VHARTERKEEDCIQILFITLVNIVMKLGVGVFIGVVVTVNVEGIIVTMHWEIQACFVFAQWEEIGGICRMNTASKT